MVYYRTMANDKSAELTGKDVAPAEAGPERRASPDWLPRWELAALAVGDLLALVIFAAIGGASHGTLSGDAPLLRVLNTAAPFMLAWLLVGMVVGVYQGTALYPVGRVVGRTLVAGILAGPLGVVLRALWLSVPVSWSFMLVATGTSTLALLIWRVAWSRLRRVWWPELP